MIGPRANAQVCVACLCKLGGALIHLSVNLCGSMSESRSRGRVQNSTWEASLGVQARGSPEGTARLEEPSAGQQLNKRWKGSVRHEGQEHWEAQTELVETNRCWLREERKDEGNKVWQKEKKTEWKKRGKEYKKDWSFCLQFIITHTFQSKVSFTNIHR